LNSLKTVYLNKLILKPKYFKTMPNYEHYPVTGAIVVLNDEEATTLMNTISPQWEDEETNFGKIFVGVYDWAFSKTKNGMEIHMPKLRLGGEIPLNKQATTKFGMDIFGDCFLKIE
jgi:hypothetical protein